jgi:hypothetical protein
MTAGGARTYTHPARVFAWLPHTYHRDLYGHITGRCDLPGFNGERSFWHSFTIHARIDFDFLRDLI